MAGGRFGAAALPALLAVTAPVSASPPEMHSYVTLAGVEYHVATLSGQARVSAEPAPMQASPAMRDRMRAAVREATGCRIVDDRWVGSELHGRLDCTDRLPVKVY